MAECPSPLSLGWFVHERIYAQVELEHHAQHDVTRIPLEHGTLVVPLAWRLADGKLDPDDILAMLQSCRMPVS